MTVINTRNAETISIGQNGTYDVARYTTANIFVGGKYQLLSRVKDDSNNDIGCVVGYHTDANNQKYAVVCLNKQYRNNTTYKMLSDNVEITTLGDNENNDVFSSTDTATSNCDKILSFISANPSYTSEVVNACRSLSFVIDGVNYYGQIPTVSELTLIFINKTTINSNDPSLSGPDISFVVSGDYFGYWSSSKQKGFRFWWGQKQNGGLITNPGQASGGYLIPILEIPID